MGSIDVRPIGVQQLQGVIYLLRICCGIATICIYLRMANTYSQIILHVIFAVKSRNALLPTCELPRIHAYIAGTLKKLGHFPYAVGGIENHVHILLGFNITHTIPDMVRDVKSMVSRFINDNHMILYRFEWQAGYGCFSYSKSQVETVCHYISRQHEHHKSVSFEDEMRLFLDKFDIEYDERYMLTEPK